MNNIMGFVKRFPRRPKLRRLWRVHAQRIDPIGESRIKHYDRRTLTIAYKHPENHSRPTFDLAPEEFLRRFLVHVPPKGQRVVRHFGLFHHRLRQRMEHASQLLTGAPSAAHATPRATLSSATGGVCPQYPFRLPRPRSGASPDHDGPLFARPRSPVLLPPPQFCGESACRPLGALLQNRQHME